jgi:hypothetical protein
MTENAKPIPENLIAVIRYFSFWLGNRTLDPKILPLTGEDYRPWIVQYGSDLEMIYTVFLRNLTIDSSGAVHGADHAARRAAQWIRRYCDATYVVDPPFSEEEERLAG